MTFIFMYLVIDSHKNAPFTSTFCCIGKRSSMAFDIVAFSALCTLPSPSALSTEAILFPGIAIKLCYLLSRDILQRLKVVGFQSGYDWSS